MTEAQTQETALPQAAFQLDVGKNVFLFYFQVVVIRILGFYFDL